MSGKNIVSSKNKKPLEGWKIALIVISIVIVIGIIILLLFIFVFNKDIISDIPIFSLVSNESIISKIDPRIGFGLLLPKQNIFINFSGTMLAFGNPYYLNSNGDIGAILFYEKNTITGKWEINSKKIITSTFKNQISFGNSICGSDDFKYIYIAVRVVEDGNFSTRIAFAILQSNGTYNLSINEGFTEGDYTRSVYCSPDSSNPIVCAMATSPASILFGRLLPLFSFIRPLQFFNLPDGNQTDIIVTGGGGSNSNYIACGFAGTDNSIINIYDIDNNVGWILKYFISINKKTSDNLYMNQFPLSTNNLAITGSSSLSESSLENSPEANLLLYGLTKNSPTLLTSTSFIRGTIPIIKLDGQLINEYSSSVSMDGESNLIVVGTQTKDVLIYSYTNNPNKLNLIETISQNNNIQSGLAIFLSANSNVLAFTIYDPINFNYGFQIYEKNLIEENEST